MTQDPSKLWQTKNLGSGTFVITKPKRKKAKLRASRVKNKRRGR
jgi:hypothetical protein